MATVCRFMRGALLTEFGRQYFLVAKVRGINKFNLLTRYALPNVIIPIMLCWAITLPAFWAVL